MNKTSQRKRIPIDLAIFDMDGVIFSGDNFWLELHGEYGTTDQGVALAERLMERDYGRLASLVAGRLWKGRPSEPFERLVSQRSYEPDVKRLFAWLNEVGIRTAVVSSGPEQLALRAKRDLGIDEIRANLVKVTDGTITGHTVINVPDSEKVRVGLELIEMFGTTAERTMFVGDSDSDAALVALVGLGVAYAADSPSLLAVADVVLDSGQLADLADLVVGPSSLREADLSIDPRPI
ncbi:MAG: HAD-IB family phosphatase [Acidimicrobiia bacterium]|nr:HAD-IB family phosphatase [Acidimicrobiia bacterium]